LPLSDSGTISSTIWEVCQGEIVGWCCTKCWGEIVEDSQGAICWPCMSHFNSPLDINQLLNCATVQMVGKAPLKKILTVSVLTLITRFVVVVLYVIELTQACLQVLSTQTHRSHGTLQKWPIHGRS
jgi:hypothetical protein